MFDLPFKLFPPALLAGLLLYAGITALWLQPLVQDRLAARHLIPRCEAGLIAARSQEATRQQEEKHRRNRALDLYRNSPLGQLPFARDALDQVEQLMRDSVPALPVSTPIDHSSRCACAVTSAFEAMRIPMLRHVMSLRSYRPAELDALPLRIGEFLGTAGCGGPVR